MDIKTYLKQHKPRDRRALADAAGTKLIYLRQISAGLRRASADLAIRLEHASNGLMTAREIRPDLPWREITPNGVVQPHSSQSGINHTTSPQEVA
ncbi:MAG: hypothetical protein EKK68_14555 [Candidatus Competibacteraceae bacterium]|nr:MAG: hypothetical protein EKK68_14555 [Candidatus Competibacteraceae bacterium]